MYATDIQFAGQKASKGRIVLVRRAGKDPEPAIVHDVQPGNVFFARTTDGFECTCTELTFHPEVTAENAEDMPAGGWAWPPRV
jgi:hypothetical protein